MDCCAALEWPVCIIMNIRPTEMIPLINNIKMYRLVLHVNSEVSHFHKTVSTYIVLIYLSTQICHTET